MSRCAPAQRQRVQAAAREAAADPAVVATDCLPPTVDPQRTWTVEIVCEPDAVPPGVLQACVRNGLHVLDVSRRGPTTKLVARA